MTATRPSHPRSPVRAARAQIRPHDAFIQLWAGRGLELVVREARKQRQELRIDGSVAELLGVGITDDGKPMTDPEVHAQRIAEVLLQVKGARPSAKLQRNTARVARLFGLNATEAELLMFLAHLQCSEALDTVLAAHDLTSNSALAVVLAHMLDLERAAVLRALDHEGSLQRSGLIVAKKDRHGRCIQISLQLALFEVLMSDIRSDRAVIAQFATRAPPSQLTLQSHEHLGEVVSLSVSLLKRSLGTKRRGVNLLLYGPPGTGKTELARNIVSAANAALYEVTSSDAGEVGPSACPRLWSYARCQRLISALPRSAVLFDEAEDAFPSVERMGFGSGRKSPPYKGWTTKLLEENRAPTLWLTNDVEAIDEAFLRRFDLVVHVRPPPEHARRALVQNAALQLGIGPQWVESLAADARITPAVLTRAAQVARLTSTRATDRQRALKLVLDGFTAASGSTKRPPQRPSLVKFELGYLNTSPTLPSVVEALRHLEQGTVLLHGPPGTGKTELAHHVARVAQKPLLTKRASDLLGSYVGQTERSIRSMFEEARDTQSFLLLDEADSFLRDRQHAHQSWEVTLVNELLMQMESFARVFLCSTNLAADIDPAAFRRFDLKVRCGPLTAQGRLELVTAAFGDVLKAEDGELKQLHVDEVSRLEGLCIGDVVSVRRGLSLSPVQSVDELLARLRGELAMHKVSRRVGFA